MFEKDMLRAEGFYWTLLVLRENFLSPAVNDIYVLHNYFVHVQRLLADGWNQNKLRNLTVFMIGTFCKRPIVVAIK